METCPFCLPVMRPETEADNFGCWLYIGSTVLKVGHHGSSSSTSYPFLRAIMPKYAVISVGEDNSYGHPSDDTLSRLRDADVTVYRTDMQGTIICTSDGQSRFIFYCQKRHSQYQSYSLTDGSGQNSALASDAQATDHLTYIGNVNSKKFHLSTCNTLPAERTAFIFKLEKRLLRQVIPLVATAILKMINQLLTFLFTGKINGGKIS